MLEHSQSEFAGIKCISLKGRIDSISADEAEKTINEFTISGERKIIIDFNEVNYISSVGLRVFLKIQKELKKANGELILTEMPASIHQIFKSGGFLKIFTYFEKKDEILSYISGQETKEEIIVKVFNNVLLKYKYLKNPYSKFKLYGSTQKLPMSEYSEEDIVNVKPEKNMFGTGLSSIGTDYNDYKDFFGESIIIDGSLFYYPATNQPAADFMLFNGEDNDIDYKFFHGFSFSGNPTLIASFEGVDSNAKLSDLIDSLSKISKSNFLGIVILTESKGIWGMHLKKVPIMENKPENNQDVFSNANFPFWMNFPIEPTDFKSIIIATGIAIKDKTIVNPDIANLFAKDANFHLHSTVMEHTLINKSIESFNDEMNRVVTEQDAIKVQHLLGQSVFSSGVAAIYDLDGD